MAEAKETYQLHYFQGRGRAEPIRLALSEAGANWEFVAEGFQASYTDRQALGSPFGSLPLLKVGDDTIFQSTVILAFIGKKFGLYPQDIVAQSKVEGILNGLEDLRKAGYGAIPMFGGTPDKALALVKTVIPRYFGAAAGLLSGDYFLGDEISVADFFAYDVLTFINDLIPGTLDKYETLKAFVERIAARPNIAAYLASDRCFGAFSALSIPAEE